MKVKIIVTEYSTDLEDQLNEFLQCHNYRKILDIKYTACSIGEFMDYSAMIIYE